MGNKKIICNEFETEIVKVKSYWISSIRKRNLNIHISFVFKDLFVF